MRPIIPTGVGVEVGLIASPAGVGRYVVFAFEGKTGIATLHVAIPADAMAKLLPGLTQAIEIALHSDTDTWLDASAGPDA